MKKLLAALFWFISASYASSQKTFEPVIIQTESYEAGEKIKLPFKAIKIIDARFDKSNIGCVNKNISLNSFKRLKTTAVFPDSLQTYLPELLKKLVTFTGESTDTLAILIKQFRVAEQVFNGVNLRYDPQLFLKVSASFFKLEKNHLSKLFSTDDIIHEKWPIDVKATKERIPELRLNAVMAAIQKLFLQKNWQVSSASFPLSSVNEGLEKRFRLPVFTDTVLKAGVYKNFTEFKQNNPSLLNVQMGMSKNKLYQIKDEAGKPLELKNFWGACDGKRRYIVFRNELYELIPSDKSFRFLSYSQTSDLAGQAGYGDYATQNGLIGAALIKAMDNAVNWEYFFLNMDEEEIYLEEVFGKLALKKEYRELLK